MGHRAGSQSNNRFLSRYGGDVGRKWIEKVLGIQKKSLGHTAGRMRRGKVKKTRSCRSAPDRDRSQFIDTFNRQAGFGTPVAYGPNSVATLPVMVRNMSDRTRGATAIYLLLPPGAQEVSGTTTGHDGLLTYTRCKLPPLGESLVATSLPYHTLELVYPNRHRRPRRK